LEELLKGLSCHEKMDNANHPMEAGTKSVCDFVSRKAYGRLKKVYVLVKNKNLFSQGPQAQLQILILKNELLKMPLTHLFG